MKINLKLRHMSAYFSPNKPIVADNEDITIEILDKGRFAQRIVLLCNGKAYLCDHKAVTIPRAAFGDINVFELQEREHGTDRILQRVAVENLLVIPCVKDYDGNRLVTERTFYARVVKDLLARVKKAEEYAAETDKKIKDLEEGKFTMFKFGGNNNE